MLISWVAWLELEFTGTGYEYTLYTEIGRWKEDVGIFTAMYKWECRLVYRKSPKEKKNSGSLLETWNCGNFSVMMFWTWFKDDFRTCGDNRNGDSLLSYQVMYS